MTGFPRMGSMALGRVRVRDSSEPRGRVAITITCSIMPSSPGETSHIRGMRKIPAKSLRISSKGSIAARHPPHGPAFYHEAYLSFNGGCAIITAEPHRRSEMQMATERGSISQSISLRRSPALRARWAHLLSIGLWLGVGLFVLYDEIRASAGGSLGWAYLVAGLVLIPTALSQAELRSWMRRATGSHWLIRAVERPQLTFFSGWIYILGWTALSALLAHAFATYAAHLIEWAFSRTVDPRLVAFVAILLITLHNLLGYRPRWRLGVWLLTGAGLGLAALALLLLFGSSNFPTQPGPAIGNGSLFHSAMLLMAAMWVIELTSELQQDRNALRSALLSILGGPLLGWLFGLAIRAKAPSLPDLGALAEAVLPQAGQPVLWGIGLLTTGIAWQMLALLM
ncbi:MAG TPA: APC family permease, partial [Chloroflexi bacterium]|nr:APC family permease [Chloroflexota bacterium]